VGFDVDSFYPDQSYATLDDATAGVQLFIVHDYDWPVSPYNLWLDKTHVYSLYLEAFSSQGDSSWAVTNLSFTPDVLYVDANSPNDPGSGTTEDPFRRIQYGIDAASDGNAVMLLPGTYTGAGNRDLDFKGKAITVRSENPNDPNVVAATIIDCNGSPEDRHRGFYFHSGEDANSILEGFTITNGYGLNEPFGASEYSAGGAIYCITSSPTIRNCVFANNYSHYWGGAVHCDDSSAAFSNCTFKENVSFDTGGGLYNRISRIKVSNCLFTDNSADVGGGMYNIDGTSTVKNTLFVGNSAAINGGGLRNKRVASTISNCTFFDNQAPSGGAIHNVLCEGTTITNCILWGNPDSEMEGDAEVSYCAVKSGWPGEGNIGSDPCFADPQYHLQCDSPCVDAGDPMTPVGEEPFPNGGIINMGAYGGTAEAAKSCFGGKLCETEVDGDINGDCRIDAMDLRLMVFHWIEDIPPSPPPCETIVAGDLNHDCHINFEDFCLMALHWCEDNNP
jgi:hypothetical protein